MYHQSTFTAKRNVLVVTETTTTHHASVDVNRRELSGYATTDRRATEWPAYPFMLGESPDELLRP